MFATKSSTVTAHGWCDLMVNNNSSEGGPAAAEESECERIGQHICCPHPISSDEHAGVCEVPEVRERTEPDSDPAGNN